MKKETRNLESPTESGIKGSVFFLAFGTFMVGTDAFVVSGFLPSMAEDFHVSVATAGQSVTVFAVAYAILSPVLATLTATWPRRSLLCLALVVLGVANLLSAISPTYGILIVSRILAAAGAAAYTPNAGAVASSLVPSSYRGRALAIVISGLTIATAVGVPLGTLASQVMGWRIALVIVGVFSILLGGVLIFLLPSLAGGPGLPLRQRLSVLGNPAVQVILPVTVLGMAAAYTAYAYAIPAFESVGVEASSSQWMLFLYGLGAVIGAQVAGRATDSFGGTRVLTTGYIVMALSIFCLGLLSLTNIALPALVGVLAVLWGASSWCQTPPQQHRLIGAVPNHAPLVIALNSSALYAGIGVGTMIGGAAGAIDTSWLFFSGAVVAVLAGAFLLLTRKRSLSANVQS
ncbi:MFS transporter [Brevibacterium picturae]|uniref:MFS transporter n=1 Tax=Brevibacterium picturae TaxID=260553 RepID=A0ABP4LVY2_9MICO